MDYSSKKFICRGFKGEGHFPLSSVYTLKYMGNIERKYDELAEEDFLSRRKIY
jgi:hypothetical protein